MVFEVMAKEEEQMFVTGMLLLFDLSNFGMNHFTAMPISMVKKLMPCWEVKYCGDRIQNIKLKHLKLLGC